MISFPFIVFVFFPPTHKYCLLYGNTTTEAIKKDFHWYDFIKLVLDRIFKDIEGQNDAEKYLKVSNRCTDLYQFYKKATLSSDKTLDYSDPVTMFSYIYRNTAFHAKRRRWTNPFSGHIASRVEHNMGFFFLICNHSSPQTNEHKWIFLR